MLDGYKKTTVKANLIIDKNPDAILKNSTNRSVASYGDLENIDSPDLLFAKFVLVSEQENSNGDYFARDELIQARHTPVYKPFNIEHKLEETASYISSPLFNDTKNTIIGHIVGSALARKDGTILTEEEVAELDTKDDPTRPYEDRLDIVASAVLYKFYFPQTVADIEDMINNEDYSVSMEAWYKGFDFIVGDEFVKADDSNFEDLVKKWATGKVVGGRRVSRRLNSVLFGAVAGTNNPANIDSVFLSTANKKLETLAERHAELHILYKVNPCQKYIDEHNEIMQVAASLIEKIEGDKNG